MWAHVVQTTGLAAKGGCNRLTNHLNIQRLEFVTDFHLNLLILAITLGWVRIVWLFWSW